MEYLIKTLAKVDGELVSGYNHSKVWVPGEWYTVEGELGLCSRGFHACFGASEEQAFIRAMGYVYPHGGVWRVESRMDVIRGEDKLCARSMRLVEEVNREEIFKKAWPGTDPSRLKYVDDVIEWSRLIDWSNLPGGRDVSDIAKAFKGFYGDTLSDKYWAAQEVEPAAARAAARAVEAVLVAAAMVRGVAMGACPATRYYFGQIFKLESCMRPNPFISVLKHYSEGGNWDDIIRG